MNSPLIISLKKLKNFYGSKIVVLSPAKLNLYLNCIGQYPQTAASYYRGFHRHSLSGDHLHRGFAADSPFLGGDPGCLPENPEARGHPEAAGFPG